MRQRKGAAFERIELLKAVPAAGGAPASVWAKLRTANAQHKLLLCSASGCSEKVRRAGALPGRVAPRQGAAGRPAAVSSSSASFRTSRAPAGCALRRGWLMHRLTGRNGLSLRTPAPATSAAEKHGQL